MQFGRALVSAAQTHTLTGSYPIIVGTYSDGVTVHIVRAEDATSLNTPFAVQVLTPVAATQPFTCDGMHNVRTYLSRRQLNISGADWTTAAVPAAKGSAP